MLAITEKINNTRTAGVNYFNPDDYIINIIRRATANQQNLQLNTEEHGKLILLSTRGEYFSSLDDIKAFCRLPAEKINVTLLSNNDKEIPDIEGFGRNIDELMWMAAYYISDGRLIQGCYRYDVVEIQHWPNLTRLPHTPNTPRIISFLRRYPTSITLVSHLLKIEAEEIFQIYSAAHCAGLTRIINRKPEEPELNPHRNHTLLSALLNKIAGL